MAHPLTVPPWADTQVTALRQLDETTTKAKLRLRAHRIFLAHQGRAVAEMAAIVLRSRDTVERVLTRLLHGGSAALPPRPAPGRAPTVPPAWKADRLRVIDRAPPTAGVRSAHWPTSLLATSLAAQTQGAVTAETVRLSLRAAGGVCKRPTWTRTRKAEAPPGSVGNACGWRESWLGPARRGLHP
jgi:transposase